MAWQRQEGAAQPSAYNVQEAATSAAWEIVPAAEFNAADVSRYSKLDHPTYTKSPRQKVASPTSPQRSNGQAAAANHPTDYAKIGNTGKDLPASPQSSGSSATPHTSYDDASGRTSLRFSESHGSRLRTTSAQSQSLAGPSRQSDETGLTSLSSSKLDSGGGVAGLFGASSISKGKKLGFPWRSRMPSSQGTSTESRSSRDRPGTASTDADKDDTETTPRRSLTALPGISMQSTGSAAELASSSVAKVKPADSFGTDAAAYYEHVMAVAPRDEVPTLLSSSGDELRKGALALFMKRFLFAENPLDVALRKMLMSLRLPKETQQIDRIMEAFARRYNECNEGIYDNDDQPYVLAFSFMMLHTDTFNRNAKQKMTKADYIRNTSSSNVHAEVLEYFYDNLTFTEFIHVEDDESTFPGNKRKASATAGDVGSALRSAVSKTRIDPYYIIATGQTHTLRANIAAMIPPETPFSALGSREAYDFDALHSAFVYAPCIEIITSVQPQASHAAAGAVSSNFASSSGVLDEADEKVVALRVTKVGCISRKDDMIDENRKAPSRKWRTCGMILSASQLLFFKDLVWTSALEQQILEQVKAADEPEKSVIISPRITYFKPDGVLGLTDAVAVKDVSSNKYKHVFRLFAKHGELSRQYLIQTTSEDDMNDWIHKINFCSTFRSTGVRIRALDPPAPRTEDADDSDDSDDSEHQEEISDDAIDAGTSVEAQARANHRATDLRELTPALRKKLQWRRREIEPLVAQLEDQVKGCEKAIEDKMHFIRHLSILTPWMKVTRDRIEVTALPVALYIRSLRLAIARYTSRRDLLVLEIDASERAAVTSPSTTHFDALEFAQRSFWSASTTSLTLSSYAPSTINGSRRGSQMSNMSSRAPSLLEGSRSVGNLLDVPLPSRFSFSDATGSVMGSGTSTPGDASDADTDNDASDLGALYKAANMRPHGRHVPTATQHRGSASSAASFLRRVSGASQNSANGVEHERTVLPQVDENDQSSDTVNTVQHHSQAKPALDLRSLTSPLFAAAMTPTQSSASYQTSGHAEAYSNPLFSSFATPAASSSLHGKQQHDAPREEAEAWNKSRVARDSKRVSLVQVPDTIDWQTLADRRFSVTSGASHYDSASNGDAAASSASDLHAIDSTQVALDRLRFNSSLATSMRS